MPKSPESKQPVPNSYPPWAPRFWNGMRMGAFLKLLRENRFKIHPYRYGMTAMVGLCAVVNSTLSGVQHLAYGKRIRSLQLEQPPIFIIGHWRSGTTLMHELLALDQRFAYPNNFDAFTANHFLVSRRLLHPIVQLLMPQRRPMDNMSMSVTSPQEDDFALCGYGAPTPYRRIAFPNRVSREHLNLDLNNSSPLVQEQLRDAMEHFLKCLTIQYESQLVLKSPPHTGRIKQLAEWFPGAKFIHLSRHPYKLVPSTMRLWRLLDMLMGFQLPKYDDQWLKNYIFECKDLMYTAYFEHRAEMPDNRLVEVRFESLVANPGCEMRRVYDQLELGEFDQYEHALSGYFESKKDHQTNPFTLDPALQMDIDSSWHQYMDAFDYERSV